MRSSTRTTRSAVRRKAVWGPKRTLALVALLVLGLSPSAFAAGHHRSSARKAVAGRPNSQVKNYKVDGELTRRSANPVNTVTNHKSKVIVELLPGRRVDENLLAHVRMRRAQSQGGVEVAGLEEGEGVHDRRPGFQPYVAGAPVCSNRRLIVERR